jgi:hypothetical protein
MHGVEDFGQELFKDRPRVNTVHLPVGLCLDYTTRNAAFSRFAREQSR